MYLTCALKSHNGQVSGSEIYMTNEGENVHWNINFYPLLSKTLTEKMRKVANIWLQFVISHDFLVVYIFNFLLVLQTVVYISISSD